MGPAAQEKTFILKRRSVGHPTTVVQCHVLADCGAKAVIVPQRWYGRDYPGPATTSGGRRLNQVSIVRR